ncbi:PhzF family phenazine biosynthesis protein [uncultured Sphingorhabdus sp.]|uniref:PhzF family phenazine biosynthesis protein n=1 Tax=uncultured Sphingorhabdus sp. TaxID=1686106 RepID=UPI002633355E|nr:PhzF family phenazine biosynthesis protein [uncultured Sphingorhabdus sp.]HMS21284.1 PhzF family phenazine biosynthesis protein [Sphingorhabdus sp.]
MPYPIYVIDAFTSERFAGNPAAVVLFDQYPEDVVLQAIAAENNLAETAFPVRRSDGDWDLRWFTPTVEVPLCGHATLASTFVLFTHVIPEARKIVFHTRQSGQLSVHRQGDKISMDFPAKSFDRVEEDLSSLFGTETPEIYKNAAFTMVVLPDAEAVSSFVPDRSRILELDRDGLIITAPGGSQFDCVSRFFTPAHGIDEDPVTGGAHTMIAPYWADRLGRPNLRAYQASARGGSMECRVADGRVEMRGQCAPYMSGQIEV